MLVLEQRLNGYDRHGGIYDHDSIRLCLKQLAYMPAVNCMYDDQTERSLRLPKKLAALCELRVEEPRKMPFIDMMFMLHYLGKLDQMQSDADYYHDTDPIDARSFSILTFFNRFWSNRFSGVAETFYQISYSEFINVLREDCGGRPEISGICFNNPRVFDFCRRKMNLRKVFETISKSIPCYWRPYSSLEEFAEKTRGSVRDMEECLMLPMLYAFELLEKEETVLVKYGSENMLPWDPEADEGIDHGSNYQKGDDVN